MTGDFHSQECADRIDAILAASAKVGVPEAPNFRLSIDLNLTHADWRRVAAALRSETGATTPGLEAAERLILRRIQDYTTGERGVANADNACAAVVGALTALIAPLRMLEKPVAPTPKEDADPKRIRCVWVVEKEFGYGKAMRVVASNHPRFIVGSRFDFGFLTIAVEEGYRVSIAPVAPHVLHAMKTS